MYLPNTSRDGDSNTSLDIFSVSSLDSPLCEEIFTNVQSKPPCCDLKLFSYVLSLVTWQEKKSNNLTATSFQVVVEIEWNNLVMFESTTAHLLEEHYVI